MKVETIVLDALHLDPSNVRSHGESNMEAIRGSLARFGQVEPLVVQGNTGRVIGGNGRLEAMKQLGWQECEVVRLDLDDLQASALGIALNRTSELAHWDEPGLAALLEVLREEDALEGVGYTEDDIDELVQQLRDQEEVDKDLDDDGPEDPPEIAVAKLGDLWVLGDHRLLCGDSTNLKDVQRVMGGDKAALVATDPPYLVDYTGERPNDSRKDWTDSYREIDIKDADGFFKAVFTNVLEVLGHKRCGDIQRIWRDLGILDHQQIIWVKPASVFGRVYWHFRHEPCVMGWKQGDKPEHDGVHDFDSVWEVDWEGKARSSESGHPMVKPVELFTRPMKKHTKPGDIVFEPFSGSGSQIIAAERTGRVCRAIEISPPFVDVAINRWQKATALEATLDDDGRTFIEVAAERLES